VYFSNTYKSHRDQKVNDVVQRNTKKQEKTRGKENINDDV
jgi:hypothetical protein